METQRNADRAIAAGMSARTAGRILGISPRLISRAIKTGELRAYRIGARRFLIRPAELHAWIEGHAVRPTAAIEARADEIIARDSRRPTAA